MPKPTVGRIVHYVGAADTDPPCAAAIITAVGDYPPGTSAADHINIAVPCSLQVFTPVEGCFTAHHAMQSELGHEGGTWHWPEREEG